MQSNVDKTVIRGMARLTDFAAAAAEAGEAPEFALVRRRAAALCQSQRWPGPQDEEWRRSRVEAFAFDELAQVPPATAASGLLSMAGPADEAALLARAQAFLSLEPELGADRGAPVPALAELSAFAWVKQDGAGPAAVSVWNSPSLTAAGAVVAPLGALAAACAPFGAPFAKTLTQKAAALMVAALETAESQADSRFASWNLAAWNAGLMVYLPRGAALDKPIAIDWQLGGDDLAHQPLLLVAAEDGSAAELIVRYHGEGGYLVNNGILAQAGADSSLRLSLIQETGAESVWIGQGRTGVARDARFRFGEAHLGGGFVKSRLVGDILGSGADVHLDGLYFGDGERHIDLRSVQNHYAARATSRALYKGVAGGQARNVYQGLILVSPDAGGTDAFLANRNLVLDDGARADSIPTLQIRTNDVRCSHGSTTGTVDPEEVFYLQNRGLSRGEAESLIVGAFLDEIANGLAPLARDGVRRAVAAAIARRG